MSDAQTHHERFLRQQHERDMARSSMDANAAAAELIAERIAAKLAEQNEIIYSMGQRQGRTSAIAYLSSRDRPRSRSWPTLWSDMGLAGPAKPVVSDNNDPSEPGALTMKLYWCEQSRAQRAAWMLEELGEPYERIRVGIRDGENKNNPEFRAASPLGKVPALVDGTVKLNDSGAICLYLADKFPASGLTVPLDDPRRGEFLQWLMFTNAVIEPAMTLKFMDNEGDPARNGWGSFETMLATLTEGVAPGPWLLGDQFTAADVMVGSSAHFMDIFGLLPDNASPIKAYAERCRTRPAYVRAAGFEPATE